MIPIKADNRLVKKGDTFIALRGVNGDGHDYIEKAIANGASKIIAEEGSYDVETIIVPNTREYLKNYLVENYSYLIKEMKIIGVTGTNGKTTTAYLIHNALNMLGIKCGYIGTVGFFIKNKIRPLNNTTPDLLDLYNMFLECYDNGCKCIAIEVSSQGIANKRVETLKFDYAIFTNLTQDHLDYHITMENYALAKQILFKRLKKDGKAIINNDDEYKNYFLLKTNNNITYGFSESDYMITNYRLSNLKTTFTYQNNKKTNNILTHLIGKYNIYNLLAAIVVLKELNISDYDIAKVCSQVAPPNGRMTTINYRTNSIVIDYAHTPDAIEKIIDTMRELTNGRIFVVFGCTGDRDRSKRSIMTKIVTDKAKFAFLTNDDPHYENPKQIFEDMTLGITNTNYTIMADRKKAIITAIGMLKSNDILLILGKGHEEFMIIKDQKIPFNDENVVKKYLEEIKI
ncbi:MAG: UDP-N-acetylmuramoyl-L-alanyl-D-glutamate--2,6-diaminopimelate ligase [Bacilli bacterium]|nr:UDP-N-acetylmuramoyl-L-alanyl-D-glutamate--2,6-diaminopimelate ligase [Bacilli bacterium]